MSELEVLSFPFLSVPFPRNANPFQNSLLPILKQNGMFTYPFTVFSQKVDMGSGHSCHLIATVNAKKAEKQKDLVDCSDPSGSYGSGFLRTRNPHDVSRSGFLGTKAETDTPSWEFNQSGAFTLPLSSNQVFCGWESSQSGAFPLPLSSNHIFGALDCREGHMK